MNSFIVDDDPVACAAMLDPKRLGKQRLECKQMLNAIENGGKGWINHPCTNMWRPYIGSLRYYTNCMIDEWVKRGYNNTMEKFTDFDREMPWWFKLHPLQQSHKAALLRKDYQYYNNLFSVDPSFLSYTYVWISKLPEHIVEGLKSGETYDIDKIADPLDLKTSNSQIKTPGDLKELVIKLTAKI